MFLTWFPLLGFVEETNPTPVFEISKGVFGLVADGRADDSEALQHSLTHCSEKSLLCVLAPNLDIVVSKSVFMWGTSGLKGNPLSEIRINVSDHYNSRYIFNFGISEKLVAKEIFSGSIQGVNFVVLGGPVRKGPKKREKGDVGGRVIKLWRVNGIVIAGNTFKLSHYMYAAIGSSKNSEWLTGAKSYVLEDAVISENLVKANSGSNGMEGLGLTAFDGALIEKNSISGVGDDVVGLHRCENIVVSGNTLSSIDGRLLIVSSNNVKAVGNTIVRQSHGVDSSFSNAQALMRIGSMARGNRHDRSTNVHVVDNLFIYPLGAVDKKAAILVAGAEDILIESNTFINKSKNGANVALRLEPFARRNGGDLAGYIGNKNIVLENNEFFREYGETSIQVRYICGETVAVSLIQSDTDVALHTELCVNQLSD